ncbi:MAG: hypothetical protein NTX45_11340 [Proteobacteria bacterium]|nr:hypothetical protein [Pseudomonadota bacterium]
MMKTEWLGAAQTANCATKHCFDVVMIVVAGLLAITSPAQGKEANPLNDRQIVLSALLKSGALNKDRQLVHLSHVCNLRIDGRQFPVVDVMELVPGAATPRGVNRIIVLTDGLMPVQTINYTTQRPLFCKDQRLFVHGDIMIGEVLPEGNVLSFSGNGRNVSVQQIDVNKLPIPATGTGKPILQ